VCALQWSAHDKELVSSHGYSHNQLILWKYPSMVKVAELTGHTSRVLHMAQSPDGTTVVSAAADETLRFWKILGSDAQSRSRTNGESVLSAAAMSGASRSRGKAWQRAPSLSSNLICFTFIQFLLLLRRSVNSMA